MSQHSSTNSAARSRLLVASFHDLTAASRPACERFLARAADLGVGVVSLLVVPRWRGGTEVADDNVFARWLADRQREGHEICLHGLDHRSIGPLRSVADFWAQRLYTAREAEFHGLTREEARRRLKQGRVMLARAGLAPTGFVAPAWLMSGEALDAAADLGFPFTTCLHGIVLLPERETVRAPSITFSARTAWRRTLSRRWLPLWARANCRAEILRLVAHPADFEYPEIESLLFRLLGRAARDREAVTYEEVVNRMRRRGRFE